MTKHTDRDVEIIRAYVAGRSVRDLAEHFNISRGRLYQILKDIVKVRTNSKRTEFLGVNVTEETKVVLERQARAAGVSVSKIVSDRLDEDAEVQRQADELVESIEVQEVIP